MAEFERMGDRHPARLLAAGDVPALDGLRAASVLIVMVSHAGLGWLVPGGFGVTMFFFISGFIITTLLIREHDKSGRIDIRGFYFRRALRLYPALFAFVVAIVLAYALFAEKPGLTGVAGGFLYFMNYLVIFRPGEVLPHGNHLWSLAVEAHFYLLYPWLFARCGANLGRLAAALSFACLAALAVRAGAAWAIADKAFVYEYAYQASEARLDSIAFGALCAALLHRPRGDRAARLLTHPATVAAGLALLALTLLVRNPVFRDTLRYSLQGVALMPLIAACVLGARFGWVRGWLNAPLLVLLGAWSYSLYLWHPAVFALGPHLAGSQTPGLALGWLMAFAAAAASYAWIETPMLRVRRQFGSQRPIDQPSQVRPSSNAPTFLAETGNRTVHMTSSRPADPTIRPPRAFVDGWPIHFSDHAEALRVLVPATLKGDGYSFCPLNVDLLVKLRSDAVFADAMRKARYVICDGWPVAALGRKQDPSLSRATGADLVMPLCEAAVREGIAIYLFGTSPQTLQLVQHNLKLRLPGLEIAGMESPALGFDPRSGAADAAIERIKASGARLCFLALGAPKQEVFAARALDRGAKVGFISVGAGLDFIAGSQVRAPQIMRNHGMEGVWRLMTSPRRLGSRYAVCALFLARLTLLEPAWRWLMARRTV